MIIMNPNVCPPNSKLPPDVASPIGNVVWEAKSKIVVKKGNIFNPTKAADKHISQKELSSKPSHIKAKAKKLPQSRILHFLLYWSFINKALPTQPNNPAPFAITNTYPHY